MVHAGAGSKKMGIDSYGVYGNELRMKNEGKFISCYAEALKLI